MGEYSFRIDFGCMGCGGGLQKVVAIADCLVNLTAAVV